MPRQASGRRAGAVAIVAADGIEGQGGIERFTQYLTQAFGAQAPDLSWFIQKTRFRRGAVGHLTTPFALAQFARRCAAGQVAVAHINVAPRGSTFRKMLFAQVARAFGVPVLLHLHGSGYDAFYDRCPPPARALMRRFFLGADRVAVLGSHWRQFASEVLGVPSARLLTVENGVPEPAQLAQPTHTPAHIVFAGTLGERKGVDVLIESLRLLDAQAPQWRASLAGGGDVDLYRRQADAAGIGGKIDFPGWLSESEVTALMASADVFVLPSRAENQPIAILEAMARALPVVSTAIGAIPEQVEDGVSGLLVPPGEATPLADALRSLVEDPARRKQMGEAGRQRFLERYSIKRCATAFLETYEDLRRGAAGSSRG